MIAALASWVPRRGYVAGLHPGDVGWHLRHDDGDLEGSMFVVRDEHDVVACAIVEPAVLRPAIRPDRADDAALAAVLADIATQRRRTGQVWSDAPSESAYRAELAARGWQLDPDPWCVLFRRLDPSDGDHHDPDCAPLDDERDVAERVAVQVGAFTNSTFTVARWHQMAAGPGFDPRLDFVRRDANGRAVAAATAWTAGRGRVGILEPVGTHADHHGSGHGTAVSRAAIAGLARAGASGVVVATPAGNEAAVRTYLACGLTVVEQLHAMASPNAGEDHPE